MKREFIRYIGVGGVAFIADLTLLAALTLVGLHYLPAALIAFLLGGWVNYHLSVRWVFRHRAIDARGPEFGLFLLVGVITLGLSLALMAWLVESQGSPPLLAKCLVTAFTVVVNFGGRRALLFTRWSRTSLISSSS